MTDETFQNKRIENHFLTPIGIVRSALRQREDCPLQEDEGAPTVLVEIFPSFVEGLEGIAVGREVLLLTWLHKADRKVLKCYMRDNIESPPVGVFTTRSPDRPNPIGLHYVKILKIDSRGKIEVSPLEVIDGTPIIDIKPVLNK